jgi:hypothetical protein
MFNKKDYLEGQADMRIEIADYLVTLSTIVTGKVELAPPEFPVSEHSSSTGTDLTTWLKVLADRIRCCDVP